MSTQKTKGDVYTELVKLGSKVDEQYTQLTKKVDGLIVGFVKLNAQVSEQNEKFVTKEDNQRVLNLVDSVLGEVKAMRQEQAAHFQQHEDIDQALEDHHKRIKKLEGSTAAV